MENVIIICLVIIIFLLLHDKTNFPKKGIHQTEKKDEPEHFPDIMGKPKPYKRQSVPKKADEYAINESTDKTANFEVEVSKKEVDVQIPQEELEEIFSEIPDLEEEEEEWNRYGVSDVENGLAQGVTFEELGTVGMLLQKEKLEPSQKETAVAIVQKIDGTELFNLLESSMEGASQKIAELLDSSLPSKMKPGSSTLRKKDIEGFDIGEFL